MNDPASTSAPVTRQGTIIVHAEADRYSEEAMREYRTFGRVVTGRPDRGWLRANLEHADILIVRLGVTVDTELLAWCTRLKIVASPTTGLGHIDIDACRARGVDVISFARCTHKLEKVGATAEHAVGLMLALLRGTVRAHAHVLDGGWQRNLFVGRDLSALTVGLVGLGRIGSKVAMHCRTFGASVVAYDPFVEDARFGVFSVVKVSLHELVDRSDLVSLHASVTDSSRGMLDRSVFARMRRGTLLVNTARGELVDEDAMLEALDNGRLGGVALDVLRGEPNPATHDALIKRARRGTNIIMTPHIGGCTSDSLTVTELLMARMVGEAVRKQREY